MLHLAGKRVYVLDYCTDADLRDTSIRTDQLSPDHNHYSPPIFPLAIDGNRQVERQETAPIRLVNGPLLHCTQQPATIGGLYFWRAEGGRRAICTSVREMKAVKPPYVVGWEIPKNKFCLPGFY